LPNGEAHVVANINLSFGPAMVCHTYFCSHNLNTLVRCSAVLFPGKALDKIESNVPGLDTASKAEKHRPPGTLASSRAFLMILTRASSGWCAA
jgi:hypothetical protein